MELGSKLHVFASQQKLDCIFVNTTFDIIRVSEYTSTSNGAGAV